MNNLLTASSREREKKGHLLWQSDAVVLGLQTAVTLAVPRVWVPGMAVVGGAWAWEVLRIHRVGIADVPSHQVGEDGSSVENQKNNCFIEDSSIRALFLLLFLPYLNWFSI